MCTLGTNVPACGVALMNSWSNSEPIVVARPSRLPIQFVPAERLAFGEPGDYKPCLGVLADGTILLTGFHPHDRENGQVYEEIFLARSRVGGGTWSPREIPPLLGREPYVSATHGDVLFVTAQHLENDVRNPHGHVYALVHRSEDAGRSWSSLAITPTDISGAGAKPWVVTSRNILERADGTLILGVSAPRGHDYLWRSIDAGQTWDRSVRCTFADIDTERLWWPFWAETVLWEALNGDLLGLWRIDPRLVPPLAGSLSPDYTSDNIERLIVLRSVDGGRRWTREPELGSWYGEMYPSLLRLPDGRLLCTFTVRSLNRPLGVHAVLGRETPDGLAFDFQHDRLIIDVQTPTAASRSGGGFGPSVLTSGGALLTAYSWRDFEGITHVEIVRWHAPAG